MARGTGIAKKEDMTTKNRKIRLILVVGTRRTRASVQARGFPDTARRRIDTERSPENLPALLQNTHYDVILLT